MAKFQIFQYLFRPVMENQAGLPAEEFQAVNIQDSIDHKQELLGSVLNDFAQVKVRKQGYWIIFLFVFIKIKLWDDS